MSLPIILGTSGVDWKGDAYGSGNVKILGVDGDPLRMTARNSLNESAVNVFDVVENIPNILSQASPAANTSYVSSVVTAAADGFDVVTFVCVVDGTGTSATQWALEVSMDNSIWLNTAWHPWYVVSPQAGATKEGIVEVRTAFKYLRIRVKTEGVAPTGSITCHAIRSLKHSTGMLRHPIDMNLCGDGILNDAPPARGVYEIDFLGAGVATANYIYLAMFNPSATNPIHLTFRNIKVFSKFTSNTPRTTTGLKLELVRTSSQSGGTAQTITQMNPSHAAPLAVAATANPTVAVTDVIYQFPVANSNGALVEINVEFTHGSAIIVPPNTGAAFRTPTALSTTEDIGVHVIWSDEV